MAFTRAMGRAWMPRLVGFGWRSERIIKWLGVRDIHYTRGTMLADIRQYRLRQDFTPKVMDLVGDKLPTRGIMSNIKLSQKRKYRVLGEAKKFNVDTGRIYYEQISFYDDTLRTKDDWSDAYIEAKSQSEQYPSIEIKHIQITMIEHNKGYPY